MTRGSAASCTMRPQRMLAGGQRTPQAHPSPGWAQPKGCRAAATRSELACAKREECLHHGWPVISIISAAGACQAASRPYALQARPAQHWFQPWSTCELVAAQVKRF